MITAYNAVSEDGYIARVNGDEDFIPDDAWEYFLTLCDTYPATILGGTTYAVLASYPKEEFERYCATRAQKIVVTRDTSFTAESFTIVQSPSEAVVLVPEALLCSGPGLNTAFLDAGLIDKVMIYRVPVTIGTGIPQFHKDMRSMLQEEKSPDLPAHIHVYRVGA
jgi:dihydrofolate reductase